MSEMTQEDYLNEIMIQVNELSEIKTLLKTTNQKLEEIASRLRKIEDNTK